MLSSSQMDGQPSLEHVLLFRDSSPVNLFVSLHLGWFPPLSSTRQTPGHPSKPRSNVNAYGKLCVPPHPTFSSVTGDPDKAQRYFHVCGSDFPSPSNKALTVTYVVLGYPPSTASELISCSLHCSAGSSHTGHLTVHQHTGHGLPLGPCICWSLCPGCGQSRSGHTVL